MENLEISHDILIAGSDFESCRQRVSHFFAKTLLLRYDELLVMEDKSINGRDENFWPRIQEGLTANKEVLAEFLESLKQEGFASLDDIQGMEKGYLSKILHTIAHLQDGFIGIDSRFYNLDEDSHGVSRYLRQKINAMPENFWLLRIIGRIAGTGEDPLDVLRTFEGRGRHID